MPTSSQAMILKSTDTGGRFQASTNFPLNAKATYKNYNVKFSPPSFGRCERVQFDFSVSANPEREVGGFEGVFAFDQNTQSYRWQIYSVPHKGQNDIQSVDHSIGDHCKEDSCASESLLRQSSDCTGHFNTPAESLIDNSHIGYVNENDELQKDEGTSFDEATYRRLEELGFRKRTTYTLGGSLVQMKKDDHSPFQSPRRCPSEPITSKEVPKLTIKNVDNEAIIKSPKPTSARFKAQPLVCEETMRAKPHRQKSLLEEVKESVNWANRVTPSTHHRSVVQTKHLNCAICFSLRDSWKYDHVKVKDLVESQTQCEVKTLHFDPISLRTSDRSVLDRWIVAFTSSSHCTRAIERGLSVGGDKVVVRSWDDIIREEQGEDWAYPCNYRLPSEKHERALRKFLQVH